MKPISIGRITGMLTAVILMLATAALAMDREQSAEFNRIMHLSTDELSTLVKGSLQKHYPGEDWKGYRFPDFVFTNESVEAGYKIAVKKPELLAKIPCYCACDRAGHKNLLDCFLKGGKQEEYDKHASFCLTCYTEAILAFLWVDQGATEREILDGMAKWFRMAIEKRG